MYTQLARVRSEAWFSWTLTVGDPTILEYQRQATGIINSIVGKRYNMQTMLADATFSWSDAQKTLARCEELLGAGHLLNKDYDIQDLEGNSNWSKKISEAYDILGKILSWDILLTSLWYDEFGNIIPWTGNQYPTISSSSWGKPYVFPSTSEWRIFTLDDKY